jgi:hypothetical protein
MRFSGCPAALFGLDDLDLRETWIDVILRRAGCILGV